MIDKISYRTRSYHEGLFTDFTNQIQILLIRLELWYALLMLFMALLCTQSIYISLIPSSHNFGMWNFRVDRFLAFKYMGMS